MIRLLLPCALLFVSVLSYGGDADWPQWRGENRDGYAAPQSLLSEWTEGGPKLKWQFDDAGSGYSTAAIVDGRLFTLGQKGESCFAICLNAENGELVWETEISRAGTKDDYNQGWGGGPRSTPTVDGDQVFVLSDVGVLASLERTDGKISWSTDLVNDLGGEIPVWGYSDSPLVDNDRVVVTPGGKNFMVAVDRKNGEKVWQSQGVDAPAQYVSIMRHTIGSTSFYVTASKPGLFAFDVESGKQVFSNDATGNNVAVIPTPILAGQHLYHTSDYGAGNTLLKLSSREPGSVKVDTVYHETDKTMRNHHGGVVLLDGVIYGFTKANGGAWMAQDLETGKTLWEERVRPNRSGSICLADGLLYCYNDKDGTVLLVEPNREQWILRGKLTLPRQTEIQRDKGAIWAHPIVADQTLIIRDQDLIFAFDIAKE